MFAFTKRLVACGVVLGMLGTGVCSAEDISIFSYAGKGLSMGILAGAAGGYIRYQDTNPDDMADNMGRSVAYGALIGTGLGVVAAAADTLAGEKAVGYRVMDLTDKGGKIGLLLGLVGGGISALNKDDTKVIAPAASWGYLGGLVLGAGWAIYKETKSGGSSAQATDDSFRPDLALMMDSTGATYPVLTIRCAF